MRKEVRIVGFEDRTGLRAVTLRPILPVRTVFALQVDMNADKGGGSFDERGDPDAHPVARPRELDQVCIPLGTVGGWLLPYPASWVTHWIASESRKVLPLRTKILPTTAAERTV